MSYCVPIKNGIICFSRTDFNCPKCGIEYHEEDYWNKLYKSKKGLIYIHCKGCKEYLGITTDIQGDVHTWIKSEEKNFNQIIK